MLRKKFAASWAIAILAICSAAVDAAQFQFLPVGASGSHTIVGNEIRLTGGGQRVFLELKLSGWGPRRLKAWQVKLDANSYSSGIGDDLTPETQTCPKVCVGGTTPGAACTSTCPGGGTCSSRICDGGANVGMSCSATSQCPSATCRERCIIEMGSGSACPASTQVCDFAFQARTRTDWVHFNEEDAQNQCGDPGSVIAAVDQSTPGVRMGAVVAPPCFTVDPGTPAYGGTLVVDVPINALGTYTFSIVTGSENTFMSDDSNPSEDITPLILATGKITVLCANSAQCNDGSACTTDTCNAQGTCVNSNNFNPATHCCNPSNGSLTPLSDGIQCTQDLCDPATGVVIHPNSASGSPCGSQTSTQCNQPDTCNGSGVCQQNVLANGAPCGDPADSDCNGADTCDGNGTCLGNIRPSGTACGNFSDTECDNPDTCNGAGTCLPNSVANNTPCNDGLFCTINERCTNTICGGGSARNCDDLLTCTEDICDEANDECDHNLLSGRCLIDGVCYMNGDLNPANQCEVCDSAGNASDWTVRPDGSLCNDGNACTGTGRPNIGFDTCTSAVCAGVPDPLCNADCPFAVDVVVGSNLSNNSAGGVDDGEASCQIDSNNDVWFKFTPICTGQVFVSTTGSQLQPSNDTVLTIFDDCPSNGGVEIVCDDDSGVGLQSAAFFTGQAGVTYIIRVAGYLNNTGNILLNLRPVDDCLIDGVCYGEDDLNPENDCQACIPDLSSTGWSPRFEGSACGNNADTECDSPDACDGAGFCEVNNKPNGTACADEIDPNICTQDFCNAGLCTHPPEPAGLACGDGTDTECDNPDTCDGNGACASNLEGPGHQCGDQSSTQCDKPDVCNGLGTCVPNHRINGFTCNDGDQCTATDRCFGGVCVGNVIPLPPDVEALSGRLLSVTPQQAVGDAPVALLVTSPEFPCLSKYIDGNGHLVPASQRVDMTPSQWGTVIVSDLDIAPDTIYHVQAECGTYITDPGIATTDLWGDVDRNGRVNIADVAAVVDMFKEVPNALPVIQGDLDPCPGNNRINISDVAEAIDAFKELPYPCGYPCH